MRLFRLVTIWLALALAIVVLLIALAKPLQLGAIADPEAATDILILGGVGWLIVGVVAAAASMPVLDRAGYAVAVKKTAGVLTTLSLLAILACLIRVMLSISPQYAHSAAVQKLDFFFAPGWALLGTIAERTGLPRTWGSMSTAPVLMASLLLIGRIAVNWAMGALAVLRDTGQVEVDNIRVQRRVRGEDAQQRAQAVMRKVAVSSYAEAKALLETTEVELTMLSMDVVGSTKMKQGEDPYVIEQTFTDYRGLVERMLKRHNAYKQTWTPDGQMAAFRNADDAVNCAQDILLALTDFNRVSKMKTEFQVRMGANTGMVSTDDQTPMEQISDFDIDIAGHMQKYADPDTLWIAGETYQLLSNPADFAPNGQEVDGRKVYVWQRPD